MAIAIRGTTPLTATSVVPAVSLTLTSTRQPQAGDLLLIVHFNDFFTLANMPTPTVAGSTTGVNAVSGGSADAGSNLAHIKSYTYAVASTGDLTVAVTETGTADEEKALAVYVLSGADTTTPVDGAAGASGTASTSHVAPAVSPAAADSMLFCHANTGGGASGGAYTQPGGMTETYDTVFGGMSFGGANLQLSASGSTGTETFTATNSTAWAALSVAIKTAAPASSWTYGFDVRIG